MLRIMSGVPPITFSKDTSVAKRNEASTKYHESLTTISIILNFYHPQRSLGKVIFSEARVKNSVHGGGSPGPHAVGGWGVWLGGSPGPHPGGRLWGLLEYILVFPKFFVCNLPK